MAILAVALTTVTIIGGCAPHVVQGRLRPIAAPAAPARQRPCPDDNAFSCVTLAVPADHFAAGSPTWEVTFALHRALHGSRGVLVTATGGPGSSGIAASAQRLTDLPAEITDHYDLVFFDQRGIGLSHPFRCDRTLADSDSPPIDSASGPAARDVFAGAARTFAADCFAEAKVPVADAPRFATRQAVEDLEAFRRWLGVDRLILYGESYGTEYAQVYAAAHPEHVAELLLDGVVDLQTPVQQFLSESARAYSSVLDSSFAACERDPVCGPDAPRSSGAAYDRLAAELAGAPRNYRYPLGNGRTEARALTLGELQSAAGSVSTEGDRTELQRALNSAVTGDAVPLARLAASVDGVDPDTGDVLPDPGYSSALHFAVECPDRVYVPPGSTARAQLDGWLDAGKRAGIDRLRVPDPYYGDLTCLFWPGAGALPTGAPTSPVSASHYPELLLTADTDPNTPTENASRVFRRTAGNAALITQTGGPHVVFGRGNSCVDDLVVGVITTGRLPQDRTPVCRGQVLAPYDSVAPSRAADYRDPSDTAWTVLTAALDDPMYVDWDGLDALSTGCDAGGSARYDLAPSGELVVTFLRCAWTPGAPVTGTMRVQDGGTGDATMRIRLPFAALTMTADQHVSGVFRGQPVS